MSVQEFIYEVRLLLNAGKVVPGPKIASVLGPRGVPMPKFCEAFNKLTAQSGRSYDVGDPVSVKVRVRKDKTFEVVVGGAPVSYMLKKAVQVAKGSATPGKGVGVAEVGVAVLRNIAERKFDELNACDIDAAIRTVSGTARSMGIKVIGL